MAPIIDSQGRCPSHPFVQLQRLSPRTNEWKALLDSCPLCVMDNKSTTSSACSSVCSALIFNDDDDEHDDGQQVQQQGQALVESNPFVVTSRGRQHSLPIESSTSSTSHHSQTTTSTRGRQQSLPIGATTQPIRRSRSNSRVRFSPPTTTLLDESGLLGALAIDKQQQRPSSNKFVRQVSSSSLSALGGGNNNINNNNTTNNTVDPLTSLTICGSVTSNTSSLTTTTTTTITEPKSALKLPKYKVCPLQMKQQLDDSERVTTMSMDLNIEDDESSSTHLSYNIDNAGGDEENDHQGGGGDDDDEEGSESEEEEEEEEEPELQLCMPVSEPPSQQPQELSPKEQIAEIENNARRLSRSSRRDSSVERRGGGGRSRSHSRSREPPSTSTTSSRSRSRDVPQGRRRSSSCQVIGSRYAQDMKPREEQEQEVMRPDPEEFPLGDHFSQASTQDRRGGRQRSFHSETTEPPQGGQQQQQRRRSSSNSNARRSSSFTFGGGGNNTTNIVHGAATPPPPPPSPPPFHSRQEPPPPSSSNNNSSSSSPPQRQLERQATPPKVPSQQGPMVGHNHVNMIVNPACCDDDTISTLSFMGTKASSSSNGIPHRPNTSLPSRYSQGGGPNNTPHESDGNHHALNGIDKDESPLPRKISNESSSTNNSSTQDTMTHGDGTNTTISSSSVNTNNYDKKGRCIVHPHIRLRKKKFMSRLCLGSSSSNKNDGGGWKILMSACPDCCVDELRRIRLVEENNKRVAAKQQQQQQQAVAENKNERSLNTLDRSDRSGRMTPEGITTKSLLLDGSDRSASLSRPTLTKLDGSQRSYSSSGSNDSQQQQQQQQQRRHSTTTSNGRGGGTSSRGRRYQQQYDDSSPGFTPLPKMKRSSSLSERMGNHPPPPPPRRSPSQDSFRQRHHNDTPPKRSPSQDSYRSGSPSIINKGQLDRKLNRRMSDETASLTGSSGSSTPGIDTSDRTASTGSASKHVIQLSPVRRSSYGSQQEKIESIMNSPSSPPHESYSSKSSSSSRKKKRSKSRTKSSGSVCSSKSVETSGSLSVGQQQQDVDSNASPPSPGQRGTIHVRQMQWTNPKNNEMGAYTGQVNDLFIPHGHGIMYYTDKSLGVKEGEWKNGRYRRSNYDGEKKMRKRGSSSSRSSSHRSKSKDGKSKKKGSRSRSRSKSRAQHEQEQHESRVYQQQQQSAMMPRAA